ncbi:MAG TPA: class I SAM-dependent methyltransferase [Candidatus Bathyarchaeia archaeon]|nr:class I SAM-dependent methyltransferase [Candidatus Bathyarchaeia archaeon]
MKPEIYDFVLLALRKELEGEGYDPHEIEALIMNYSWFMSEYSLLRFLQRSELPIDEFRRSLDFLVKRHEALGKEIKSRTIVLDIGCGLGLLACSLAKKKCQVFGTDTEEQNIRVAKRLSEMLNVSKYCTFQNAESTTLSFSPATFDYVVLSWTLHDIKLDDHEPLLSECLRVLKKDGQLLVLDQASQLDFDQLQETMSKRLADRVQRRIISNVYDHGARSNATLAVYQKRSVLNAEA